MYVKVPALEGSISSIKLVHISLKLFSPEDDVTAQKRMLSLLPGTGSEILNETRTKFSHDEP